MSYDGQMGDRIRIRRKELGLTLRELAAKSNLTASFLCDVERNKRGIGADSLLAVCLALGLPIDQVMTGDGEAKTAGSPLVLPPKLMDLAQLENLPFRTVTCLYWMAKSIQDHRTPPKRTPLDCWDWRRFFEAVRDFL